MLSNNVILSYNHYYCRFQDKTLPKCSNNIAKMYRSKKPSRKVTTVRSLHISDQLNFAFMYVVVIIISFCLTLNVTHMSIKNNGSREESEVVGFRFSHLRIMGYVRLGQLRVNDCTAELEQLPPPAELELEIRKADLKTRRNLDSHLDPVISAQVKSGA